MDLTHFEDEQHSRMLVDVYRLKYSEPKPDLIIAVAETAVDFVLKHRQDLFHGVPIVIGAIEKQYIESHSLGTNITGHLTGISHTDTLDLALKLHPETKNVVVYSGASPIGMSLGKSCREAYRPYEKRINFTYLMGLPMEVLLEKVAKLPKQTVIIHLTFWKDGVGKEFVGVEALSQIERVANAPIYSFWDATLGYGIVGGYLNNLEEEAKAVAKLGLRILNGESPESIPITPAPSFKYLFDGRQLRRWSIAENRLPTGSIVKFKELTIWDQYKGRIIAAVVTIVLQALIILFLLHQRRIRRRAEKSLEERLGFEQMLSELSSGMIRISTDEVDANIRDGLSRIGTFMNVDRSYLFRLTQDKTQFRITHLWEAEGTPKDQTVRGVIVSEIFPWLYENLINDREINIADAAELPIETARSEYEYCRKIGIQSFLILPIRVENAPLCAIGLDSIKIKRKWSPEAVDNLRLIGEIFANAVEREYSEERVQAAELKYRTVADYTYDWEYWSNLDGSLEYVSPSCERISGYSVQDFKENPEIFQEIIMHEDKRRWEAHYLKAEKELKPGELQFRIQRKDGEIRWIEHVCQPVTDPQGVLLGFRASNRDITERKQAEVDAQKHRAELTHVSRIATMGELSAALAHELNQPLTAILSNAQVARRFISGGLTDPNEVNEILNDIIHDDKRAADIIKRLRALMRRKDLEFTSVDLNHVIRGVVELVNREAYSKDVPLVLELADDLPHVQGDAIHLEQVILNLILNSIEAMETIDHQSRELRISTVKHNENAVRTSVQDKGTGIDEMNMGSIFEAFYTTKPEGMGMGLSICKSIIEAHGGRLWAENNPAQGATVSFTLPVSSGEEG